MQHKIKQTSLPPPERFSTSWEVHTLEQSIPPGKNPQQREVRGKKGGNGIWGKKKAFQSIRTLTSMEGEEKKESEKLETDNKFFSLLLFFCALLLGFFYSEERLWWVFFVRFFSIFFHTDGDGLFVREGFCGKCKTKTSLRNFSHSLE